MTGRNAETLGDNGIVGKAPETQTKFLQQGQSRRDNDSDGNNKTLWPGTVACLPDTISCTQGKDQQTIL